MRALVDVLFRQLQAGAKGSDLTGTQLFLHVLSGDLGVDDSHFERQAALSGDLLHDLPQPLDMHIGAGAAGSSHDKGDLSLQCQRQHQLHVALDGAAVGERGTLAQIAGAGIGGTCVHADVVDVLFHGGDQAVFVIAVAQKAAQG